jgi:hypothetical protein
MKMNDFLTKDTTYKSKQAPIFNLNNEQKETQLGIKIEELEEKIAILERIRGEKVSIEGELGAQKNMNTKHFDTIQTLTKQVSDLTMELQDKQRVLSVSDGLKQDNDRLATEHGEAVHTLSNMRMDMVVNEQELNRLRNNTFTLESNNRSMMNAAQQKDALLKELSSALEDLKYQHDGLTSSSNALAIQYSEVSEARNKLDDINIKLNGEVVILHRQQESTMSQEKTNLERHTQAIEQRIRGESSHKIKELNEDVNTLNRINAYYKTELSKPQHMSVGAIARQEGFKIPLASSAVNYRKNNLGTGQATLLKFGKKES